MDDVIMLVLDKRHGVERIVDKINFRDTRVSFYFNDQYHWLPFDEIELIETTGILR